MLNRLPQDVTEMRGLLQAVERDFPGDYKMALDRTREVMAELGKSDEGRIELLPPTIIVVGRADGVEKPVLGIFVIQDGWENAEHRRTMLSKVAQACIGENLLPVTSMIVAESSFTIKPIDESTPAKKIPDSALKVMGLSDYDVARCGKLRDEGAGEIAVDCVSVMARTISGMTRATTLLIEHDEEGRITETSTIDMDSLDNSFMPLMNEFYESFKVAVCERFPSIRDIFAQHN